MTALSEIHDATAARFNLSPRSLRDVARFREISWPRQLAMLIMREAGYSLPQIATFYTAHHTTVMHGVKLAKERVEDSRAWKGHLDCILAALGDLTAPEKVARTRAKHGRKDPRTAWIPEGRREEYRVLIHNRHFSAAEAKSLMLTGAMPGAEGG